MPSNSQSSKAKKPASSSSKTAVKAKVTPKKTTVTKSAQSLNKKSTSTSSKGKIATVTGGLNVGIRAPAFSLPNEKGQVVKLSDLKGKKVVLFFYPKDDTPGCTKEACSFRDGLQAIRKKGAVVLGVSADSVARNRRLEALLVPTTPRSVHEGRGHHADAAGAHRAAPPHVRHRHSGR